MFCQIISKHSKIAKEFLKFQSTEISPIWSHCDINRRNEARMKSVSIARTPKSEQTKSANRDAFSKCNLTIQAQHILSSCHTYCVAVMAIARKVVIQTKNDYQMLSMAVCVGGLGHSLTRSWNKKQPEFLQKLPKKQSLPV